MLGAVSPPVVVYTSACHPRWLAHAARGGPMGEVVMTRSLIDGLLALGQETTSIGPLRAFARHRAALGLGRLPLGRRPIYFLDPWTLMLACRYRLFARGDAARIRLLEWYGTPPSLVSRALPGLTAAQYLAPYPYDPGWNRFLGFTLPDEPADGLVPKKRQGVIWGKDAQYFRGDAARVIARLAEVVELHATIADVRKLPEALPPRGVVNHGVLAPAAWRALLRESSFVLGLGDPIAGPTALDALAAGCVYLNPRYPTPRAVHDVPELTIATQHPFAERIGPPFVCDVDLRDPASVVRAAEASVEIAAADGAAARRDEALALFSPAAYQERLRTIVAEAGGRG